MRLTFLYSFEASGKWRFAENRYRKIHRVEVEKNGQNGEGRAKD